MDLTLRVDTQAGTTAIRLFKDPQSPNSCKEFACTVRCGGRDYRSDIPVSELQELLHAVRSATVSAVGGCALGLDGTSYELTIQDGVARVTYSWWMTPERGWRPLAEIADLLLHFGFKVSGQYLP